MSVEPDAVQQDYRREERREHKAMESKLPGAKFNANTLSRAFDGNRSVGSAKSQKPLPAALFFLNAVAKIAAEMLCYQWSQEGAFDIVVARPFNHIGPGQSERFAVASFASQILAIRSGVKSPFIDVGYLDASRDFCDVRDVVKAYAALLELGHNSETYNVCTGCEVTMRQVIEGMIRLAGIRVELSQDVTRIRSEGLKRICGDFSKINRDTGWSPHIRFDDTLLSMLKQ
jgi:GDP-4-dehydro-6-deoxy-D-mannose reductase